MEQQIAEVLLELLTSEEKELFDVDHGSVTSLGKCIEPSMGKVLQSVNIPYFLEVLELDDDVYREVYPTSTLDFESRKTMANEIITHIGECVTCYEKVAVDERKRESISRWMDGHRTRIADSIAKRMSA